MSCSEGRAQTSMSCSEGRAWTSTGFSEGKHGCTEKQRNPRVAEEVGHKHPRATVGQSTDIRVYRAQGTYLLRKLKFRRSNPSGQLQFERYGLLCMLGSIFCSSPTHKCLSSS
jgi:hypothetical protein